MLTSSFWIEAGLVNGAVGSMNAICYTSGDGSPHFLVAVMVCFDGYSGPTFADGTVPICIPVT